MSRATADAALSTERHEQPHPRRNPPSPLNPDCRCQRQSSRTSETPSAAKQISCQRQSEATIIIAKRGRRLHADRRSHLIQIVALQEGGPRLHGAGGLGKKWSRRRHLMHHGKGKYEIDLPSASPRVM